MTAIAVGEREGERRGARGRVRREEREEKLGFCEIFKNLDNFRAGTFKFEKNPNYEPDINKFEKIQQEKKIRDLEKTQNIAHMTDE